MYSESWTCDDFPILPDVWDVNRQAPTGRKAEEHGKEPFIVLMRKAWVADTFEQAVEQYGAHYVPEMRFYCEQGILAHHPEFDSPEKITVGVGPRAHRRRQRPSSAASASSSTTRSSVCSTSPFSSGS